MAGRSGRPPRRITLATGYQLWRLNEQGLLRVELAEDAFVPGGPPEGWAAIPHGEAFSLLGRLADERWVGLGRWPKAGESWAVRDGLVVPLGVVADEEART